MWWQGRLYAVSDRDGVMNLWSLKPDGTDPKQLTRHRDFDVKSATLHQGRIAYQQGADLWLYDIAQGTNAQRAAGAISAACICRNARSGLYAQCRTSECGRNPICD